MSYSDVLLAGQLAWLLAIAVIDVRTLRAPNRLVYPSIVMAVVAAIPLGQVAFLEVVMGGLLAFGILTAIVVAGRGRMGAGDAKVGAVAGMTVGLGGVPTMLASAFLGGAAIASMVLVLRLRARTDVVAFTPLLLVGCLCAMAFGNAR